MGGCNCRLTKFKACLVAGNYNLCYKYDNDIVWKKKKEL